MDRFTKNRSLSQLLQLVESSPDDAKSHVLLAIHRENPAWASLIRTKVLTPERVLEWDARVVRMILDELTDDQIRALQAGLLDPSTNKLREALSLDPARIIRSRESQASIDRTVDRTVDLNKVSLGEITAARLLIVSKVRDLESHGTLDLSAIAPLHVAAFGASASA